MAHANNSIITGKFKGSLGNSSCFASRRAKQSLQNRLRAGVVIPQPRRQKYRKNSWSLHAMQNRSSKALIRAWPRLTLLAAPILANPVSCVVVNPTYL
jgi:hypothetical protein